MPDITVVAERREDRGKNAARRHRVGGRIPGVLYGGKKETTAVSLNPKDIISILRSAQGENTLFQVKVGSEGESVQAMIRDFQLEPIHHTLLHADLLRIAADQLLHLDIPVVLTGDAPGVKEGGLLEPVCREIKVECLPAAIPERITVDVSGLSIGGIIRLRDIQAPQGVEFLTEADVVLATVAAPRKEEEAAPVEVATEAPAEPEVLKKGKAATEGEEEGKE
ncbi:MAG: 50S ribosomal protein L25 [Acidobacteria bacterium]|nr:50S ribosomal protein L25 [Acidobacteriota bacterium]